MDRQSPAKRERLAVRVTAEQKALIQRAADLEGRTLTSFMIRSLQEAATETIRRHEVMTLSLSERVAFVEALLTPPDPSQR